MIAKRLLAAAEYLKGFSRLHDCGTDHAYLPIHAVSQGFVMTAVASDNKQGPLENAKANIEAANLNDKIDLILADGLANIDQSVDVVAVLGMGGRLIVKILEEANLENVKRLVLGPNSEVGEVREFLQGFGWQIIDETFLSEKKKFYQIICAERGLMRLSGIEKEFGPFIIRTKNNDFDRFLNRRITILKQAYENTVNEEERQKLEQRIAEMLEVLS